MANKDTYEAEDIVKGYSNESELQKPEEAILNNFKNKLREMRMLDIGVGGGRTTLHFAPLVKEYVGIDYSQNMIKACKKRFINFNKNISFETCDVRDMNIFKDNHFDFILFSFNGIDYISQKDRLTALSEIKRVCKNGGHFCFSTHNLNSIDKIFRLQLSANPIRMLKNISRYILLKLINRNLRKSYSKGFGVINDGADRFKWTTYYIEPTKQIEQLYDLGFKDIQVYSLSDGTEIANKSELGANTDFWLYYLCNV